MQSEAALPLLQTALRERGVEVRSVTTSDKQYIEGRRPHPWQVAITFETDPTPREMRIANLLCAYRAHIDIFCYRERVIEPPVYGRRR